METKNLDKIEKMFAFIASDETGEGVIAFKSGDGWMPLVGADWDRVNSLKKLARDISIGTNKTVTLVEFSVRKDLEII